MQPFSGTRVLDLTHVLAGPFASYQLAVLGADVIKVERPGGGDLMRRVGGAPALAEMGIGTSFMAQNANKRSIVVDLSSAAGLKILLQLVENADVLLENFRGGALARLGLDYDSLKQVNQRLVYCSLTGFGDTPPHHQYTAYDNVIQAASGLMSVTGTADTRPLVTGAPLLDYGTGFATAFAISAALLQREKNGKGQKISVSMMDTALLMMSSIVARHLNGDRFQPADGNQSANAAYGCHQTARGLLMIGAYSPEQSARLWRVLGEEEEARRVSSLPVTELPTRREHQLRILGKVLLHKTADEWVVILQEKGVPASRVQSIDEAITMAATADQTTFAEIPQTDTFEPGYRVPLAAFSYESNGPSLHSPPPFYGQHTDAILGELGYSHKTITSLRKSGNIE